MRVLAMAYGAEPLDRTVASEGPGIYYLVNLSIRDADGTYGRGGVGFPANYVFKFDSALYDSLRQAFAGGNREQLDALWATARQIRSS